MRESKARTLRRLALESLYFVPVSAGPPLRTRGRVFTMTARNMRRAVAFAVRKAEKRRYVSRPTPQMPATETT